MARHLSGSTSCVARAPLASVSLTLDNDAAEVCVVGRTEFESGIGSVTYAMCELLARSVPTCLLPTSHQARTTLRSVLLPNGRPIPICQDPDRIRMFVYTDVLWNGVQDLNHTLVPLDRGHRVAHIAYDSDELPDRWVRILNERFDLLLVSAQHLEAIVRSSAVRIPIGVLPIALPVERALARRLPLRAEANRVRFGSLAAFHTRKNTRLLLESFLYEFGNDPGVELVLHSNLSIGDEHDELQQVLAASGAGNVHISSDRLSASAKDALLDSIDIYATVSRGEGFSIPPREALARGKLLVLSDIGAHRDLFGAPGVHVVENSGRVPARYIEIDGQVIGQQTAFSHDATRAALRASYDQVISGRATDGVLARKQLAAEYSFDRLAPSYASLANPDLDRFRTSTRRSRFVRLPAATAARNHLGAHARKLRARTWLISPVRDAGFFSLFNAFVSHVAWEAREDRCHAVLPDWDAGELLRSIHPSAASSYCYSTPQDGNLWCHLFEPLYDLSVDDMNDRELLQRKGSDTTVLLNEHREPLLTYIHAFDLYHAPWFRRFRLQYHRVVRDHVRLLPRHAAEVDRFASGFGGRFMFAAHVKHPSHVIEQPSRAVAATDSYIELIDEGVQKHGFRSDADDWGVFLATDQDRVIDQFADRYGDRLFSFGDVRRTSEAEDALFDRLAPGEKAREGHQVQHIVASDPSSWSVRMAWEVVRDAMVLARCDLLVHVVSNVATAVSYLNPQTEMVFCAPAGL